METNEERGYQRLHGLFGIPVGPRDEPLSLASLAQVHEPIAALLLELQDNAPNPAKSVDSEGIPTGSTVMEIPATAQGDTSLNNEEAKKSEEEEKKKKAEKAKVGDTAVVANELLQKYLRRPRKPTA